LGLPLAQPENNSLLRLVRWARSLVQSSLMVCLNQIITHIISIAHIINSTRTIIRAQYAIHMRITRLAVLNATAHGIVLHTACANVEYVVLGNLLT
jgi:hypothetical protein